MRLRRIEPTLRYALAGPCALERGATVLVAVSGGADSTGLLVGLCRVARSGGLRVEAAHLHHRLRGREADGDLEHVRRLCARMGVPLHWARWNTRARMRRRGISGQAGLRRLRQEFLAGVARRIGASAIATAHTADDQLETLLMRLARGTGVRGLGGIAPRNGVWVRPLLEAPRSAIEADLEHAGIPWREDSSNADPSYLRNRVRHAVVPALVEAFMGDAKERGADGGPERRRSARAILARGASLTAFEAREGAAVVESLAGQMLSAVSRIERGEIGLDASRCAEYPYALRHSILRQVWARAAGSTTGLTRPHLEGLERLVRSGRGGASVGLPGGWRAERDRDTIWLRSAVVGRERPGPVTLARRRRWTVRGIEGQWLSGGTARRRLPAKSTQEEYFAGEALQGTLELRSAKADERFRPFGWKRAVRLGAFLRKQKVSRELKARPTVLSDASGILWVVGVRRSDRAPVTATTRRALWVHMERHD